MNTRSVGPIIGLVLLLGGTSALAGQAGTQTGTQKATQAQTPAPAATQAQAPTPADDEKTFYVWGRAMGRNFAGWKLTPGEVKSLQQGLVDAVTGAGEPVDLDAYQSKVQALAQARLAIVAQESKAASQAFLEKAAGEAGTVKTASGLIYKSLSAGTGASPAAESRVKVHYEGRLPDGSVFDSSVKRGQPAEFGLAGVIPCWGEGLKLMRVGEKARLVCPADLAYGDQGRPPIIPGNSALVFEVELLDIVSPAVPAAAPPAPTATP